MGYITRWTTAIAIISSLFMGACATVPVQEATKELSPPTLEQDRVAKRQYSIPPDFGTLELSIPPSWQEEIEPKDARSPFAFTVSYTRKTPEDFQVLISVYGKAFTEGGVPDPETIKSILTEASKGSRARAVEKEIPMLELSCTGGKGYYFSMTDTAYKPDKRGDYRYMTQGLCPVDGRLLSFTVLTNFKDSEVVERALHAVRTAERSSERMVSETLIAQMDIYSWSKESFKVSPNSKRVAYGAQMGKKWFVVVDGKAEKEYDGIGRGTPIFSPDSKRVAYAAEMGKKRFVVVDGKKGKEYDDIIVTEGGRIIFDSSEVLHYLAVKVNNIYLCVSTKASTSTGKAAVDEEVMAGINKAPEEVLKAYMEGEYALRQYKYAEAEESCRQALAIMERTVGRENPTAGIVAGCLGEALLEQRKYAEAEPLLRRRLQAAETVKPQDKIMERLTARSATNLGIALLKQGKLGEAEQSLRRGLLILETAAPVTPFTARNKLFLGEVLYEQGRHAEAEQLYRQVSAIQEKLVGSYHSETALASYALGKALVKQGKHVEAEPLLRRALLVFEKEEGPDGRLTIEIAGQLVMALNEQKKWAEGEPLARRLLAHFERTHGAGHKGTASVALGGLAIALIEQGKYAEAESLVRRTLDSCRNARGEPDPCTQLALRLLRDIQLRTGKVK